MARTIAFTVALAMSVLPFGGVLCRIACGPASAQPAGCHEHAGRTASAQVGATHVCQHDTTTAPVILQSVHPSVAPDGVASMPADDASASIDTARLHAWAFPPGAHGTSLRTSASVLRI